MRIGKRHALFRQSVEVRRGNLGFRVQRLHIAVAHIIGQNENDVGRRRWQLGCQ